MRSLRSEGQALRRQRGVAEEAQDALPRGQRGACAGVGSGGSASLAAATKLASEPTALPWDRTGLTTGQTRWYWLRSVSAEGNVSAFAGPVTATAL